MVLISNCSFSLIHLSTYSAVSGMGFKGFRFIIKLLENCYYLLKSILFKYLIKSILFKYLIN